MKIENKLIDLNLVDTTNEIKNESEKIECEGIGEKKNLPKKIAYTSTQSCEYSGQVKRTKRKTNIIRHKNLIGQRFNKLLVIGKVGKDDKDNVIWQCKCDCGTLYQVTSSHIKASKSCGCAKKESNREDMVGKKFGSYTVMERVYDGIVDSDGYQKGKWKCICDCGEVKNCFAYELKMKREGSFCRLCRDFSKFSGKYHPNWNPNLTDDERVNNRSWNLEYIDWRKSVFNRDNYTCCVSGYTGQICAHHLVSWHINKDLRYVVSNGVTLLQSIHRHFHKLYGSKNNTKAQFDEFKRKLSKEDINLIITKD